MDDRLGHRSRDPGRSLETPVREDRRSPSRSRSLQHTPSSSHRPRDLDLDLGRERLHILENELRRERERLRSARDGRRTASLQADGLRDRSRSCRDTSARRWDAEQRRAKQRAEQHDERRASQCAEQHVERRASQHAEQHVEWRSSQQAEQRDEQRANAGQFKRSRSPSFSKKDFMDILNCVRDGFASQPTQSAQIFQKFDHKNILPNFDPSTKNQRIDVWLKKVNECASVYGWDDKTITHFAMQKLQGLAKTWYEGLSSILFTWPEWQDKLVNAFPYEQNYGQVLEDMLKRKSKFNEPIEVYYYEKLTLVNQCDIVGKRAVDCIIHGLTDRTLRSGALALRCSHPDQLLQFLVSNKDSNYQIERNQFRNKNTDNSNPTNNNPKTIRTGLATGCYNCKEKGHSYLYCTKPLLKCTKCNRIGHTANNCLSKVDDNTVKTNNVPKTMCIGSINSHADPNPNSKFTKEVTINDKSLEAFVDFGSEVTLVKESVAINLGLVHDNVPSLMKGFGNGVVQSLGALSLNISVDGVKANVPSKVVSDHLLEKSILIGQSFTEQPHIIVYKDASKLQFIDIGNEMPHSDLGIERESLLKIKTAATIELFGAASIRASTGSAFSGTVLLRNSFSGKPNAQYFVCGGIYYSKSGYVGVGVIPCTTSCLIPAGSLLCRAERVDFVNRVIVEAPELPVSPPMTNESKLDANNICVGGSVSADEKLRLVEILNRYKHCFASSLKDLGCANVAEMNIELNSQRPIVYRPYRLSHHEREKVRSMVDEMLDAGIVRESVSEYASPILLVRKKDGSFRMCIDYRMLNSVTVKERYPIPIIEDEIARLTGQACFISLDLASGYYQVPISEQSKHLTSFVTPDGQYEFNRMPFGLANAPAVFQRMINAILGSARFTKATAYIDDILIFGSDPNECLQRLEEVLQTIENANLTLNLSKCVFLRDKIEYLGYEISAAGLRPSEKQILSVMNFPRPQNVHNVRQFLGLASYFRKFIKDFARIAFPLTKMLKKDEAWEWSENQEEAFQNLKSRLIDRPILAIYDPAAETELHTDASRLGVGGILLQRKTGSDAFLPIAYYSRQTSPEEKNFHSYELETLAVVCSLRKFRVYLLGMSFKIITDCSALRSTFSKRDLIPRIARWWLLLQEFDCSIEYRAGAKMSHVDALSRNPISESEVIPAEQFPPSVMSISSEDWLHTLQLGDSELCRIRNILNSGLDEKGLRYINDNYTMKDNKLFRCLGGDKNNIRWVVPKGARWQVCRLNHDEIGHFGVEKTLERIKKSYWFAKMSRFIKKYVSACIDCAYAKNNSNTREGLLHPITKVEAPFHTLHADHLGPFVKSKQGYTHLFVVIDAFTKFCFIRPVRNTNAQNVIRALEDIFSTFRAPDRFISDRGSCFTSHSFKRFCLDKGVKHILNAVASPRSNGQVERYNRTILGSLKALNMKHGERDWDSHLGKIQWGLNNTVHKTTGRTPSEVLFGTNMNSETNPILNEVIEETRETNDLSVIRREVKDRIDSEQIKQKQYYDKGRKPARDYKEGELVKITKTSFNNDGQSKKLMPSYVGPYRVTKVLGSDRYMLAPIPGLKDTQNKRPTTVASDRMMPWIHVAALEVNEDDSDTSDGVTDND